MTTKLNPEKISQVLNQSVRELNEETLSALQQARAKALQRQAAPARAQEFAGHRLINVLVPHTVQQWIIAVMVVFMLLAGAGLWWQHVHHQQQVELDVEMLTDELPLEIFVD